MVVSSGLWINSKSSCGWLTISTGKSCRFCDHNEARPKPIVFALTQPDRSSKRLDPRTHRSDGNNSVQSIKWIHIADERITHLAWGAWKITSVGECQYPHSVLLQVPLSKFIYLHLKARPTLHAPAQMAQSRSSKSHKPLELMPMYPL